MIHTVLLCLCLWRLVDATAVEFVPVFEGDSVTLNSGLTEMKDDDVIQWRFENTFTLIAEINKRADRITVCDDVQTFRDRLKLDDQTGSLTITNTRTEHAGYYVLLINNVRKNFYLTFIDEISVTEGGSVTLNSDLTEINDPIQWRFGTNDTLIAEINVTADRITVYDDVHDGRFRDRLKLDNQTGSLIITNITLKHDGYYVLEINNVKKKFSLTFIDEISVMEGDSVTLNSDLTEINDLIRWMFGTENTLIAKINKRADIFTVYDDVLDGRFRDRLKLDNQTGSLTITNITTEHAGRYKRLTGISPLLKIFNVSFYARLPVPVISRNSSQCSSSSSYSLVCSAVNVSHVTLSWYKGNSLLSSTTVSDLSIISLPLEVEYQDKNTYSCVLNNPISNQTQHLDITQLCHTCEASGLSAGVIVLVCALAVAVAAGLCGFYYYHQHKTSKQVDLRDGGISNEDRYSQNGAVPLLVVELDDGDTSCKERDSQNSVFVKEDKITSVPVMEGQSITLPTEITEIQEKEMICWKFADYKERSCAKFVVIATLFKANDEEHPYNTKILKFKDSLKLNHNTGSLTITNITSKHYGHYKLHITSEGQMIIHTFFVAHVPLDTEWTSTLRRKTCP